MRQWVVSRSKARPRRRLIRGSKALLTARIAAVCLALARPGITGAGEIILHLKSGDHIAGTVVSEDASRLVLTNSWTSGLTVPLSAIERREEKKVLPVPSAPTSVIVAKVTAPVAPPKPKRGKIEVHIGADFASGPKDQEIYHGHVTWSYERPYDQHPQNHFRNRLDYAVDYGWTKTPNANGGSTSVLSADRTQAADKTDFDLATYKWYVYDLVSVGYDKILRIDFQDEIGPGMGYHVLMRTNFLLNAEAGLDYQEQYRSDKTVTRNPFPRFSEDSTWKINPAVTFTERLEFMPRVDSTDFRSRAESTLSYALWKNMALRFSMLDLYDTQPTHGVAKNDLQLHTSIGVTF